MALHTNNIILYIPTLSGNKSFYWRCISGCCWGKRDVNRDVINVKKTLIIPGGGGSTEAGPTGCGDWLLSVLSLSSVAYV